MSWGSRRLRADGGHQHGARRIDDGGRLYGLCVQECFKALYAARHGLTTISLRPSRRRSLCRSSIRIGAGSDDHSIPVRPSARNDVGDLGSEPDFIQVARIYFGDLTSSRHRPGSTAEHRRWWALPSFNRVFIIGLSILCVAGIYVLLFRSSIGLRVRAVTQNRNMSACLGIPTRKVDAYTLRSVRGWLV